MATKEQRERKRFEDEVLSKREPDDGRGADPAEYDLNSQQRREVAKAIAAGDPPTPFALCRREVNNKAGRARRAEVERARKPRKSPPAASRDPLRHARLAHNPHGPDNSAMVYWRTADGGTYVERKPSSRLTLELPDDDLTALAGAADRRGETRKAYAEHILAGHARGLRNSATAPARQLPGQQQLV